VDNLREIVADRRTARRPVATIASAQPGLDGAEADRERVCS
jgi:hypothetical protein